MMFDIELVSYLSEVSVVTLVIGHRLLVKVNMTTSSDPSVKWRKKKKV
jgi:hypothetical protein